MITVAALSYLLSSIASTGKIIEFAMGLKAHVSSAEVEKAKLEAKTYAEQRVKDAPLIEMAASITMTEKILETIEGLIADATIEVIDALDNYNKLPAGVADRRLRDARRKFCWGYHQFKYHNGGTLPPQMLQEWDMNLCGSYGFTI
jgi:hypothetical protein